MSNDPRVRATLEVLEQRSDGERRELSVLRERDSREPLRDLSRFMLDVGRETALFLNAIARSTGARRIVEVGAAIGYSTIWLAEAARANDGRVVTFEQDPSRARELRANLDLAGLADWVEIHESDASSVLPDLAGPFDLGFLDHWKEHYIREFDTIWPKLRRGGLVLADNILSSPVWTATFNNKKVVEAYVAHVRACAGARSVTVPIGHGVELTYKE